MRRYVLSRITVTASAPVRVFEVLEYKGYIGIANNALALETTIVTAVAERVHPPPLPHSYRP